MALDHRLVSFLDEHDYALFLAHSIIIDATNCVLY